MTKPKRAVPIYTTRGDVEAFIVFPMIYNRLGEWVGFITKEGDVYSVRGDYVGWLSEDPRILRKRNYDYSKPHLQPPSPPPKRSGLGTTPLPPMMPELAYGTIDVLQDEPERLPTLDVGELRPDME